MPGPDTESPGGSHKFDCPEELCQIGKWFPHAHENDIVHLFPGQFLGEEHLPCNLIGRKISSEAIEA